MKSAGYSSQGEETLANAVRHGDLNAVAEIYRRYAPAIRRFCARYLMDHAAGEDAAQEVFAKLSAGRVPEGELRPWLYRVARNQCLDWLRRRQISPTRGGNIATGFDAAAETSGPATRSDRRERRELVQAAIDQLPDDYRSVLLLKHVEGLTREEIAVALELSDAAIKGRLVRASMELEQAVSRLSIGGA